MDARAPDTFFSQQNLLDLIIILPEIEVFSILEERQEDLNAIQNVAQLIDVAKVLLYKLDNYLSFQGQEQLASSMNSFFNLFSQPLRLMQGNKPLADFLLPLLKNSIFGVGKEVSKPINTALLLINFIEKAVGINRTYEELLEIMDVIPQGRAKKLLQLQYQLHNYGTVPDSPAALHQPKLTLSSFQKIFSTWVDKAEVITWLRKFTIDILALSNEDFISLIEKLIALYKDEILSVWLNIDEVVNWLPIFSEKINNLDDSDFFHLMSILIELLVPQLDYKFDMENVRKGLPKLDFFSQSINDALFVKYMVERINEYISHNTFNPRTPWKSFGNYDIDNYLSMKKIGYPYQYYTESSPTKEDSVLSKYRELIKQEYQRSVDENELLLKAYFTQVNALLDHFNNRITSIRTYDIIPDFIRRLVAIDKHIGEIRFDNTSQEFNITLLIANKLHSAIQTGDQLLAIASLLMNNYKCAFLRANPSYQRPQSSAQIDNVAGVPATSSVRSLSVFQSVAGGGTNDNSGKVLERRRSAIW